MIERNRAASPFRGKKKKGRKRKPERPPINGDYIKERKRRGKPVSACQWLAISKKEKPSASGRKRRRGSQKCNDRKSSQSTPPKKRERILSAGVAEGSRGGRRSWRVRSCLFWKAELGKKGPRGTNPAPSSRGGERGNLEKEIRP